MPTTPNSSITLTLDLRATALLACEGLATQLITAEYTVACVEYDSTKAITPPRRAFKLACSALAVRQSAAALPFLVTPAKLFDGMIQMGFPQAVASEAVAQVAVSLGLKPAEEQHALAYACEILAGHLSGVPHIGGGIHSIEPTNAVKAEPVLSQKQQREAAGITGQENPSGPLGGLRLAAEDDLS